jgi:predicted ArsR family transcriptional regulator
MARISRAEPKEDEIKSLRLHSRFFQSSRGRIVNALRRGMMTADELARSLEQTNHAIRAQLRAMERDGVIEAAGFRPGTTRPFSVYRLTPEVEQLLSRAYTPFLTRLVQVFASRHDPEEVETVMRDTGRALAEDLGARIDKRGSIAERLAAASQLMNDELGAVTHVEQDGDGPAIKGGSCPLSALTDKNPGACLAIESLLTECLGVPVQECCERQARPTCCFRIGADYRAPGSDRGTRPKRSRAVRREGGGDARNL